MKTLSVEGPRAKLPNAPKAARGLAASEHQIQTSIVQFLDAVLPPDIRVVAVANAPRSKATGGREKARGMKRGVPDLFLTGRIHAFLEVKTAKGSLGVDQMEWELWCERVGQRYAIVRSVEEVRFWLNLWGISTREA